MLRTQPGRERERADWGGLGGALSRAGPLDVVRRPGPGRWQRDGGLPAAPVQGAAFIGITSSNPSRDPRSSLLEPRKLAPGG